MFTQPDMDLSNFGVDEQGKTVLMDLGDRGVAPDFCSIDGVFRPKPRPHFQVLGFVEWLKCLNGQDPLVFVPTRNSIGRLDATGNLANSRHRLGRGRLSIPIMGPNLCSKKLDEGDRDVRLRSPS